MNGMIELLGVNIKHKSFGVGKVIEQTDTYLKIEFPVGTKQFQFPEAFEKFLQCENSNIQNIVLEELATKKEKEAEIKRQKQEEQARLIKTQTIVKPSGTRQKTYPKENIAFKCNYCNGAVMMTLLVSSIMTELLQEKNWIEFQKKMDSFAMKVKCLETGQRLPDLH